jgi:N12 class adenine-specific DNA methylase
MPHLTAFGSGALLLPAPRKPRDIDAVTPEVLDAALSTVRQFFQIIVLDLPPGAGIKTFGQTVTEIEMAPTGGGSYRLTTRFARFQNVPEMLRMWQVFADVKTGEDLRLPVPELAATETGERTARTVVIAPSPQIADYLQQLADRADRVRARAVTPGGGQHAEDLHRRAQGRARHAAGLRRADRGRLQA